MLYVFFVFYSQHCLHRGMTPLELNCTVFLLACTELRKKGQNQTVLVKLSQCSALLGALGQAAVNVLSTSNLRNEETGAVL